MNREIRFRVWDKKRKGFLFDKEYGNDNFAITQNGQLLAWHYETTSYKIVENFNEFTIQLYTGLKDKNKKTVYEGDIIEYDAAVDGKAQRVKSEIVFLDGAFCLKREFEISLIDLRSIWEGDHVLGMGALNGELSAYEVVGNIFENPGLLNE